ncbi:MAG: transglutaminase-like cysteine peptidase [Gammaproteobacteria bacterium]
MEFSKEYLDKISAQYGDFAKRRLVGWQKLIADNQSKSEKEKLEIVNNYFNLITYKSDVAHWGQEDYWATPIEFLVSGEGDCEDYSISKYYTLVKLGVPDEKLMITYVKALTWNQAHMVLTYYETPTSVPLVLDNLEAEILPASQRKDLKPIYSFNGMGLWSAKQQGLGKKLGQAGDLKMWSAMEERMQEDKIGEFR